MTTEESFAILKGVENEKNPFEFTKDEWVTFSEEQKRARYKQIRQWEKEHDDRFIQAVRGIVPKIGLPGTIVFWSDYRAVTVTRIISHNKIAVRYNETKCNDYYSGDYEILPELKGGEEIFTKRRNGKWAMEGLSVNDSCVLALHYQRHYIYPTF